MSNIKELTMKHHRDAERCEFVKVLLSGNINPDMYATFLWNQYLKYSELEALGDSYKMFENIEIVKRKEKIYQDFIELWKHNDPPVTLDSTAEYINHINTLSDYQNLFAHIYVHHMGDLSGGQIIAKRVPGQGRMYYFQTDTQLLKDLIRSRTTDDMAPEAGICFNFAIKQFNELLNLSIAPYTSPVNK
jgi:heme oxygenase